MSLHDLEDLHTDLRSQPCDCESLSQPHQLTDREGEGATGGTEHTSALSITAVGDDVQSLESAVCADASSRCMGGDSVSVDQHDGKHT